MFSQVENIKKLTSDDINFEKNNVGKDPKWVSTNLGRVFEVAGGGARKAARHR